MRYVRFLKTPRIVPDRKKAARSCVSCLITVTSDLGDSFLPVEATLSVELLSNDSEEKLLEHSKIVWNSYMRELPVSVVIPKGGISSSLRVRIGIAPSRSYDKFEELQEKAEFCGIVSAWSAPFDAHTQAPKVVERRFVIGGGDKDPIRIWEETGESIARHLWDAGIAFSNYIGAHMQSNNRSGPLAQQLLLVEDKGKRYPRVLELGTGCGIVGITLARITPNAEVIVTDLPEAQEIIEKNTLKETPSALRFETLDWEHNVPEHFNDLDLIVAADCTYNADSCPALVKTISGLVENSPQATVVIAMKKRHSSEDVFFDLMAAAGFATQDKNIVPLPGDEETGEKNVEIYYYRMKGKTITDPTVGLNRDDGQRKLEEDLQNPREQSKKPRSQETFSSKKTG